jgi:O-antigen/teichoic acid export membrane protein
MADAHKGMSLGALLKNTSATLGRQLLAGLLSLATTVVIARVFGPEANGAYAVALLLPGVVATFLNLGLSPANVYFIGSGQYGPRAVFRTTFALSLWLSALGLALGAGLIILKGEAFFPGVPTVMLWLALATLPIGLVQGIVTSVFQGLQQFKLFNLSLLAQPLITLLVVSGLAALGVREFEWLVAANFLGAASTLAITTILLRKLLVDEERGDVYEAKQALGYGYKAHLANILAFVNYKADLFLVNLLINPAATGVYVIAVSLAERLWLLSQAVSTVAFPRLAELSSDEVTRLKLTPLLARTVFWATAAAALVLGLVAFPLVKLLFGEAFMGSVLPLLILLIGIIVTSPARIVANDIAARGRPEINMYASMVTVVINIVGNLALIPEFGLVGAAVATSVAYSINSVIRIGVYWRMTGVQPMKLLLLQRQDLTALKRYLTKSR